VKRKRFSVEQGVNETGSRPDIIRDTNKLVDLLTETSQTQPLLKRIEELEMARKTPVARS
jgi:hypothetical protein